MQVYRDLRIITARPTPDEERRAPHRLYGHVDAAENYSDRPLVQRRRSRASRRRRPPAAPPSSSAAPGFISMRSRAGSPPCRRSRPTSARTSAPGSRAKASPALHAELARARSGKRGAAAAGRPLTRRARARSGAGDRPLAATPGMTTASRRSSISRAPPKYFWCPTVPNCSSRIDARFDAMMAAGALDEVRALAARGLDPNLPAMKAHGVPWLIRAPRRRDRARRSGRGRQARYTAIHQAAGDLVSQSAAGLRMGRAKRCNGGGRGAVACLVALTPALINAVEATRIAGPPGSETPLHLVAAPAPPAGARATSN